jgi:hypothetical protein
MTWLLRNWRTLQRCSLPPCSLRFRYIFTVLTQVTINKTRIHGRNPPLPDLMTVVVPFLSNIRCVLADFIQLESSVTGSLLWPNRFLMSSVGVSRDELASAWIMFCVLFPWPSGMLTWPSHGIPRSAVHRPLSTAVQLMAVPADISSKKFLGVCAKHVDGEACVSFHTFHIRNY